MLALTLLPCLGAAAPDEFVAVAGGEFHSALPSGGQASVRVRSFLLQRYPVTNANFLAFVTSHPQWRRGAVPAILADGDYLGAWSGPLEPGPDAAAQPVTRVSWFAADAYCEARHARLPDWYEWELAAAAGPSEGDARSDPAWRQQLLDWYSHPASRTLPAVGQGAANFYGLHDLHGLIFEWVRDFNSLLPADADPEKFCGSGALGVQQKDNYAVLMRIAMLGSLHGADTGHLVGFRCARSAGDPP